MVTNHSVAGTYVDGVRLSQAGDKRKLKAGSVLAFNSKSKLGLPTYKFIPHTEAGHEAGGPVVSSARSQSQLR